MSEVKPAMTAEEWAHAKQVTWAERWVDPDDPHQIAALALHDQPFGFTWEDVDALRGVGRGLAEFMRNYGTGHGIISPAAERAMREAMASALFLPDLADRIAALLPPRES